MENFDDFEKKNYKEGVEIKYGFYDYFKHHVKMLLFTVKIVFVMIQEIFQNIFNGMKEKTIYGQLALVTGESFLFYSTASQKY